MRTQSFSLPAGIYVLTFPPLSPLLSGWSTPARGKVLPSWIPTSRSACVLAPSKAWRPMCSGWTRPRICPRGLICWWRAATAPPSSSKRSRQVQIDSQKMFLVTVFTTWTFLFKSSLKTQTTRRHKEFTLFSFVVKICFCLQLWSAKILNITW